MPNDIFSQYMCLGDGGNLAPVPIRCQVAPGPLALILWRLKMTPPVTRNRDGQAYDAIAALLQSTGEFDLVTTSRAPAQVGTPQGTRSWCHLQQLRSAVRPDGSPFREFRQPNFRVYIEAEVADDTDPYQEADRLESAIRNTLLHPGNRAYGGFCLPEKSMLTESAQDFAGLPRVRLQIDGRCGYCTDMTVGYQAAS